MKKHRLTYKADELIPYINWDYFFHAWSIPHTQQSEAAAIQLRHEAVELILSRNCNVHALFALCEARSTGDNIDIEGTLLPLLRQQHALPGKHNLCLSDFVSPYKDNIGLFATAIEKSFEDKRSNDDPYTSLLIQTTADRLAEAAATRLHLDVRTRSNLWGYSPDESHSIEELLHEKHRGIRPAVGYPSLPDQSVIFIIDKLITLSDAGITLTTSGAMQPHASVCGIMIAHSAARYFAVGNICDEQLHDYAQRRGIPATKLSKYLVRNI